MPKVQTPDNTTRKILFRKNKAEIMRMLGLASRKSVYERIENPGKNIRLREFGVLAEELTDQEIVTIVRGYE